MDCLGLLKRGKIVVNNQIGEGMWEIGGADPYAAQRPLFRLKLGLVVEIDRTVWHGLALVMGLLLLLELISVLSLVQIQVELALCVLLFLGRSGALDDLLPDELSLLIAAPVIHVAAFALKNLIVAEG